MKRLSLALIGMMIVGALTYAVTQNTNVTEYVKPSIITKEVEVTPEWAEDADAVKAAQDVIQRKKWEAELAQVQSDMATLKEKETELEKNLGTYWRNTQNVKALIRATFPEDSATAIAIATCESGLKPTAHNPENYDGSYDAGLWQINSVHQPTLDRLGLDKWDPEDATEFARMLYEKNGWRDWVCYTHDLLAMR